MLWKVRYKFKQMMNTDVIETITEDQAEADALAEAYLEKFGSPNVRMVPPVEPFVSKRSLEVPAIVEKWGAVASDPKTPKAPAKQPAAV